MSLCILVERGKSHQQTLLKSFPRQGETLIALHQQSSLFLKRKINVTGGDCPFTPPVKDPKAACLPDSPPTGVGLTEHPQNGRGGTLGPQVLALYSPGGPLTHGGECVGGSGTWMRRVQ